MAEARWDIWIHLVQSLLNQGHQSRIPSHPVQVAFEYLQGCRFHNLCSLCSITSTTQKCIPVFRENLLCCSLCPLLHALALIIIKKRHSPFSLHSSFKYYIYILRRFFLSLPISRLKSPSLPAPSASPRR